MHSEQPHPILDLFPIGHYQGKPASMMDRRPAIGDGVLAPLPASIGYPGKRNQVSLYLYIVVRNFLPVHPIISCITENESRFHFLNEVTISCMIRSCGALRCAQQGETHYQHPIIVFDQSLLGTT